MYRLHLSTFQFVQPRSLVLRKHRGDQEPPAARSALCPQKPGQSFSYEFGSEVDSAQLVPAKPIEDQGQVHLLALNWPCSLQEGQVQWHGGVIVPTFDKCLAAMIKGVPACPELRPNRELFPKFLEKFTFKTVDSSLAALDPTAGQCPELVSSCPVQENLAGRQNDGGDSCARCGQSQGTLTR
jgi:hypothetical protein